jgi:hypothetical protein
MGQTAIAIRCNIPTQNLRHFFSGVSTHITGKSALERKQFNEVNTVLPNLS